MAITYCFRQTCNDILTMDLKCNPESWDSIRERIHERHFGALRSAAAAAAGTSAASSRSKYMSGLCMLKGFLAVASQSGLELASSSAVIEGTADIFSDTCIILCRSAPSQEMIAAEGRFFARLSKCRGSIKTQKPRVTWAVKSPLSGVPGGDELWQLCDERKRREILAIQAMCISESEAFGNIRELANGAPPRLYGQTVSLERSESATTSVSVDNRLRTSGIPSSLLRPAVGEEELKRAMVNAQGNFVVYRKN